MSEPVRLPRMSSDEFIAWAMEQPEGKRYELVGGEVVGMAPERAAHTRVKFRVARRLAEAVEAAGLPCEVFTDGMTVQVDEGKARTFDYRAGDVGYVPHPMGHYIENTGSTALRFLEMFKSDRFVSISLEQWMALTPHDLVRAHLHLDPALLDALPKQKRPVVPGHASSQREI